MFTNSVADTFKKFRHMTLKALARDSRTRIQYLFILTKFLDNKNEN